MDCVPDEFRTIDADFLLEQLDRRTQRSTVRLKPWVYIVDAHVGSTVCSCLKVHDGDSSQRQ